VTPQHGHRSVHVHKSHHPVALEFAARPGGGVAARAKAPATRPPQLRTLRRQASMVAPVVTTSSTISTGRPAGTFERDRRLRRPERARAEAPRACVLKPLRRRMSAAQTVIPILAARPWATARAR